MVDSKNTETTAERNVDSNIPPPAYPPQSDPGVTHPQSPTDQPPPSQNPLTATQIGEQYRAELYAQCAKGNHEPATKYGMCGIITAVVCFPIGLICLFDDVEKVCSRCGVKLL